MFPRIRFFYSVPTPQSFSSFVCLFFNKECGGNSAGYIILQASSKSNRGKRGYIFSRDP